MFFQVPPGVGIARSRNLLRRAFGDDLAAALAAFRSQIDHPVRAADHIQVVLDDQDAAAILDQPLERAKELGDVVEV